MERLFSGPRAERISAVGIGTSSEGVFALGPVAVVPDCCGCLLLQPMKTNVMNRIAKKIFLMENVFGLEQESG
jgi:hypothetical protein